MEWLLIKMGKIMGGMTLKWAQLGNGNFEFLVDIKQVVGYMSVEFRSGKEQNFGKYMVCKAMTLDEITKEVS